MDSEIVGGTGQRDWWQDRTERLAETEQREWGGGGVREVPGGAEGYLVERGRAETVLERLPQRADGAIPAPPCN